MNVPLVLGFCWMLFASTASAGGQDGLAPAYRTWLEDVSPIIIPTEREVFLKLRSDAERDKFIRFFWRQRDPLPDTKDNEFYAEYMERIRFADQYFGIGSSKRGSRTERGLFYLLLGKPLERTFFTTYSDIWPLELWFYKGEQQYGLPAYFYLIFYQPQGLGEYRLYYPGIEGPEKLVIPNQSTRTITRADALRVIRQVNTELGSASRSYLPGETPLGMESFSSDNIIASVRSLPGKKYSDSYARNYLSYKDYVETDYSDSFITAASKVRLFRSAGQPFLHWSIEPDKMSFAPRGDGFFAGFELIVRMEDSSGKLLLEKTEEIPLRLTAAQYKDHEHRRFAFQDILPVIPGNHRLFFLLKNKTGRDFTSFETRVSVPQDESGPRLSSLLLFHGSEGVRDPRSRDFKAFTFDGVRYIVSAKNEFLTTENLGAFIQVAGANEAGADPRPSLVLEVFSLDSGALVLDRKTDLASASFVSGDGVVFGSIALADVKPGYYRAEASLVSGGAKIRTEKENFIVLSQPYPVLPWAYAGVHEPFPSPEHLRLLGSEYFLAGDYGQASNLLERAFRMKDDPETRLLLGRALFGLTRFRDSLDLLVPLHDASGDRQAAKVIALDFAGLKDWSSALVYLDKLLAGATEIGVLNLAGECRLNLGQADQALPLFQKSLSLDPAQAAIRALEEKARRALERK
jgi:GWxTD domain-containing protein